ncbi:MAG: hypothetical protein J5835_02720 [Bacteroidales bacterium]|nr:hypothetical protein [Bacteroidales bacterium]
MKKVLFAFLCAAMALFTGCNKPGDSEEGQWYGYDDGGQHTGLYIELKDGRADLIISAWGDRYKGTYTYSSEDARLSISPSEKIVRGTGWEIGDDATLTSNLFEGWPGPTEADHDINLGNPIVFSFQINGDSAVCQNAVINKPYQMTRKK